MFKQLFLLCYFSFTLLAEEEVVTKINLATINALMIFTSQEGLNSGEYVFTNTPVDVKMEITHLPFLYNFHSSTNFNYFLVGNLGYNKVYLDGDFSLIPGNIDGLNSFNNIKAYTAGVGAGVRYRLYDKFYLSLGAELIYSRMGISVRNDKPLGGVIEDFFNDNHSENITYKFFALAEYRPQLYNFKPYITFGQKIYETKSNFSLKNLSSFHSTSSVTSVSIGVESPSLYKYTQDNFLTAETYFKGNVLHGTVKNVVQIERYGSIGGILYWNTLQSPWWTSKFFLETAVITADGLHGYNIGVGFVMDF